MSLGEHGNSFMLVSGGGEEAHVLCATNVLPLSKISVIGCTESQKYALLMYREMNFLTSTVDLIPGGV